MAVKKITKRWLLNSLGVILVILIALEIAVSLSIQSYYYSSVKHVLTSQANTITNLLTKYYAEGDDAYNAYVRTLVSTFEERDRMELMAIDSHGAVKMTSSGFLPEGLEMPDYHSAEVAADGYGEFTGIVDDEKILAVTVIPSAVTEECGAIRLVTSLDRVDGQIVTLIAATTLIGIAIIFFVVFTSSYFINSIVIPVGQVGDAARKIAEGDFNAKLEKKNDDEIGELCDTINYMADELGATERMKNDFISSVSHELRTPLTAIKGWAETMEDGVQDGTLDHDTLDKGMGVIIGETERLSVMVEELLDFSRLQSGRMTLQLSKLDLVAELSEAVLTFEQRAKREGLAMIYEEPDDVIPINGDRNRLRQVFVNIIDNALKYSNPGGTVTITIARSPKEGFADVAVADTGCGIPKTDLEKVKTKFYKGNSTRRGSGIGLAVADEIVRMHGGSLLLDSEEGRGTTATIRLPLFVKPPES